MTGKTIFKSVWQQKDALVERDAVAAWTAAGVAGSAEDTAERLQQLCIVGYEGNELVAISTAFIRYSLVVRENMAFVRVFVAKGHRQKGLVVPLTYASHATLEKYALANLAMKIGGTMGVAAARGTMDKPVTNAEMVLIGYTRDNDPLLARWFDHYKLDEEAARARVPGRGQA